MGMHIPVVTTHGRMVAQSAADFSVGGPNPRQSTAIGGAAGMCARLATADQKVCGRLHYHSATACTWYPFPPHCLEPSLPLTKT